MSNVLYRYNNYYDVVRLDSYVILRKTPCGVWIHMGYGEKPRFVLNTGTKRYAYPTQEEAQESFLARKRRQKAILEGQLKGIEGALLAVQENRLNDYRGSMFQFD